MVEQNNPAGRPPAPERQRTLREIFNWLSLAGFVYDFLDERLTFREGLQKVLKKAVPSYAIRCTLCMGGTSFFLFLIQVASGILLMMYYRPTTAEAFSSVQYINNTVPFGWLVRSVHRWASTMMIVTVLIHMTKVFWNGAYKPPRDLNWISGVFLFAMTLGFGFTGYLLPWSQLSYWATTVGTEIPMAIPKAGAVIRYMLRAGTDISGLTLTRFYALHVAVLPIVMVFFLAVHFLMVRRLGISKPM